jgi:hypothetical protein
VGYCGCVVRRVQYGHLGRTCSSNTSRQISPVLAQPVIRHSTFSQEPTSSFIYVRMGRTSNKAVPKVAPQSDPLRPHVTRVEKPWRQRPTRPDFPAWYRRICGTTWHRDTRPEDYDEDLSELEPQKEEDECQYDNENEEECDCYVEDDVESERTYDSGGTDVEEYYMMKDERNDRKRELQQRRKKKDVEKEHQIQLQKAKEEEVHAAWGEFKKTRRRGLKVDWNHTIPLPSIVYQRFKLFSADHADRLYSKLCAPYFPSKEVHFFYMCKDEDRGRLGRLYGEVHFDT